MSDIFISYKREEQPIAKKLADALDAQGWSIWWDPQLQAGEYFDDVIEEALVAAKCVVVLWSKRAVKSRFVKDEATYALEKGILVPAQIEDVGLPFRFANIHTVQLFGWDGSEEDTAYQHLTDAIKAVIGAASKATDDVRSLRPEGSRSHVRLRPTSNEPAVGAVEPERIEPGTEFRDLLGDGSQGPLMLAIPAGKFRMGDESYPDETPVHDVNISKGFAVGKFPITFQEYDYFASSTNRSLPDDKGWGRYQRPVINVSWHDAIAYVTWLCEQTDAQYRLLSEAEWEYIGRAGTDTPFWWGSDIQEYAGHLKSSRIISFPRLFNKKTTPVGGLPANPFGIHDTSGNVFEWVSDLWHQKYVGAPLDGSPWLNADGGDLARRVMRGGAWDANPNFMRSAARHKFHPGLQYAHVGFRVARDLQ